MVLAWIIGALLVVGLISLIGLFFLAMRKDVRKLTFYFISLASGTLLGSAFLHLIPEALHEAGHETATPFILIGVGVFLFFILEKFLIWRHCHHHQRPEDHKRPTSAHMVIVGDSIHNFIDGVIIASAFVAGIPVGVSVTIAILLHEIPQELGDFGILLHGGFSIKKAAIVNLLTASTAMAGALLTYFFIGSAPYLQMALLPITAGGFLYIALADLVPQLHEQVAPKQTLAQILLLTLGFGIMVLFAHAH